MSEHADRASLQAKAVRGAAWTMINTLVGVPVAFVVNLLVARVLGIVDYGRLALLTTLMEITAAAVVVGVSGGVIQFGSRAHAAGRRDEVRNLLSTAQGFRLVVEAPIVTLLLVVVANVEPVFLLAAVVFGVLAPAALSGGPDALTMESKSAQLAKVVLVSGLLMQGAVVIILFATRSADAVWLGRLMFGGLTVALALPFVAPDYRRAVLRPRVPPRFPPGFWAYSAPVGLASLIGTLVMSRTEIFALNWWSTASSAGAYALAFGLAAHLFGPAQALVGPLIPAVAGLREIDAASVWPALLRTVRAGATLAGLLLATALPALTILVPVLYGEEYRDVGPLLLAAGVVGGVIVTGNPIGAFVQARLAGTTVLRANLVGLLLNVAAIGLLIPWIGAWGAILANAAGVLARLGVLFVSESRSSQTSLGEIAASALPVALGALAGVASWWTVTRTGVALYWGAVASALVGGALLAGLLYVLRTGLTNDDRAVVVRALPSQLRGLGSALLGPVTSARR